MTKRFLDSVYSRRKSPKEYDPGYVDLELARIAGSIPSAVKRAIQDLYPSLQNNNKNVVADIITTKTISVVPDPVIGTNRLEYTQQFDVGAWVKYNLTVTADSVIAPDGTLTADTLATTVAGGYIVLGRWTVASAMKVTYSVYIKRLTTTVQTNFGIYDVTAGAQVVETACTWTGDAITGMANAGGAGATSYTFTSPATGWWRVSGFTNTTLDPTHEYTFFIYPRNSGNSGSIYAWGAQVNAGGLVNYVQVGAVYTALAVSTWTDLGNTNITGSLTVSGTTTLNGSTTFAVAPTYSSLTASQAVFTNASKQLVSVATTGTGSVVLSASPTFTGTVLVAGFTYSQALGSLTPYATPGAFTQTLSSQFASTVSGATLMGYGTTGDVTLKGRSGNDAFYVASNTLNCVAKGSLTVTTGFGCNGAAAQTAYASGGALNAYGAGVNGFDTGANASALYAMVVSIRAALVANGVMS
jgi:hypothetical protein